MSGAHVVEGELVEETGQTSALATRPNNGNGHAIAEWTPRFAITVSEAVELVQQKRDFMKQVMRPDEHYGVIPGTGTKPALLKPGAELLLSSMGLRPELVDAAAPVEDWSGEQHGGEAFIQYRRACIIWRQTGSGPEDRVFIARAEGSCSSWEKKYRWRQSERTCPTCGKNAIIKGKAEYGGGWVCFKKKDGCGAKFADNDPLITTQQVGQVPNPDVADLANTILKMADKRAMVAATLVATGCSDIFTQDIEDGVEVSEYNTPGMSNGEVEHGQGAPEPAKPKTRTRASHPSQDRTPVHIEAEERGAALREGTDRAAEPTGEIGDISVVVNLAALLPNTPKTRPQVEGSVLKYGYETYLKSVVKQHKLQCGSKCPHLVDEPESD